jgi:phage-related minor tail protein
VADTSLIFNIIARDKTSSTFDKIKTGAAAAGVAIGAVLMQGVSAAIENSKLDNKLAAQLGATPAQAAQLGKLSGKVYAAGFGEDLPEVNAAIKAAAQNGLIDIKTASAETAQVATKNLLTVGSVLEEDSERVSSAVSQMMRTGMARSSEEAMDLLVKATQNGVNKSQDLLDTMNEYGTQFRKLGIDGPHAVGLLSQAIKAGARDSDTAADALKEFSIRAVDGSKASAKGYELLGLDAKRMTGVMAKGGDVAAEGLNSVLQRLREMKDPVKQNAAATALFGTKAEDLGQALYAMDLDTAKQQMTGMKGATAAAAAQASQGAAGWSTLGRQFQMALVDTLNKALPLVNAVFGFMQAHSSWVQPLAIGLAALAVSIGIVTAVQWAWNAALAISPVTWIVLGIVALIAVIVLVATKTKFFQTIWNAVWGFMKGVGAWFAGPFAHFWVVVWDKIVAFAKGVWSAIKTYFTFIINMYIKIGTTAVSVVKKMVDKFSSFVNWIRGIPARIGGALSNLFAPLWNGFRGFLNRIIGGWNSLHFGIPGFSFAGISVPGVNIGVPHIPYLAKGAGMVNESGLAIIHRGEKITPAARVTPFRSTNEGGGGTITLKSDGSRLVNLLLELLREAIRDKGGDVIKVLSPA